MSIDPDRIFKQMLALVRPSAVDITAVRSDDTSLQFGSGLLIEHRGLPFVLTATHVVAEARKWVGTDGNLVHYLGGEAGRCSSFHGKSLDLSVSDSPGSQRDSQCCDVSLLPVDRDEIAQSELRPFSLSERLPKAPMTFDEHDQFYLLGFPGDRCWQSALAGGAQILQQAAHIASLGSSPAWARPDLHLPLAYALESNERVTVEGTRPSDPGGLSGSAVFWTGVRPGAHTWSSSDARLVAVLHRYLPERQTLLATLLTGITKMLDDAAILGRAFY